MKTLEKLDDKSTYKIVKYKEFLTRLQIEELQPIIEKCKRILSQRCEAIGSRNLIGRYYKFLYETEACVYLKFNKFNEEDGSLEGDALYPLKKKSNRRLGQRGRKSWICNYYRPDDTWSIYGSDGTKPLIEVDRAEYEEAEKISVFKGCKKIYQ